MAGSAAEAAISAADRSPIRTSILSSPFPGAAAEVGRRGGPLALEDLLQRSLRDHLAAVTSGARTHVDDDVRCLHRGVVVLDDEHAVSPVSQLAQRREQPLVIPGVETDRRLIQNVARAPEPRAELRGEADAETDGREGLRSLEILIASYLSARDGRRVALPLEY